MKVLFISDFTLDQREGGAQVSNSLIIEKGRELGHEIVEHDHTSSIIDFLSSYDLMVSSNLETISQKSPEKFDFILKHPNHIRLEHDSCSYLKNKDREKLFSSSKLNFFLSQFHISFFKDFYGDYFENVEIVYDPVDTNIFKPKDCDKTYDVVYCGYLHPLKGLNDLVKFAQNNPDREVSVFGWGELDCEAFFSSYSNLTFGGAKKHEEIAEIFQQSKALYHNPVVNEPFCRMMGEALLCGVEEIIGDTSKIGAYLEFEKVGYEKFRDGCDKAAEIFWGKTKEISLTCAI
jgi:glycosyltransferase involved in cell wall biosynthesis